MSWSVICDARKGSDLGISFLALVDRGLTRSTWWTSDNPRIVLIYRSRKAADFAANRLRKNRARVIRSGDCLDLLKRQSRTIEENVRTFEEEREEREYHEIMEECERGWDGHKFV